MSGGTWEYVMGVSSDSNGLPMSGMNETNNSGFIGSYENGEFLSDGYEWPDSKYYDIYQYSTTDKEYQRRILGDATGEMGPFANATYLTQIRQISSWYADLARFINFNNPWFIRGGDHSYALDAGMFAFENDYGRMTTWFGFRVVLMPN